jgi:hypothetical protein
MPLPTRMTVCWIAALCFAWPIAVRSETPPNGIAPVKSTLTGKERLGPKWTDEQRLDNCNVPPDKRGTRPRPVACPAPLTH